MKSSDKDVTRGEDRKRKEIVFVKLDEIVSDPNQPRKFCNKEALEDLAETIKATGVLQPILLREGEEGKIYLVAGERRVRAARMAGKVKIPAILFKPDPRINSLELSLIENIHRENLNPVDEAEILQRLKDKHKYTDEKLGLLIGKSRSTVTEMLTIAKLPETVKTGCRIADTPISKRTLLRIARMDGDDADKSLEFRLRRRPRPKTEIAKDRTASLLKLLVPFKDEGFEGYRKEHKLEKDEIEELMTELSQLKSIIENILKSQN